MNYFTEAKIRASAVEYLRRQLGWGKSLAKTLLEALDFEAGEIIGLSPTPLSPAEMTQFDSGHTPMQSKPERIKILDTHYLVVPIPKADDQLVEAIYELLQSRERGCFLKSYFAEAHDP